MDSQCISGGKFPYKTSHCNVSILLCNYTCLTISNSVDYIIFSGCRNLASAYQVTIAISPKIPLHILKRWSYSGIHYFPHLCPITQTVCTRQNCLTDAALTSPNNLCPDQKQERYHKFYQKKKTRSKTDVFIQK